MSQADFYVPMVAMLINCVTLQYECHVYLNKCMTDISISSFNSQFLKEVSFSGLDFTYDCKNNDKACKLAWNGNVSTFLCEKPFPDALMYKL